MTANYLWPLAAPFRKLPLLCFQSFSPIVVLGSLACTLAACGSSPKDPRSAEEVAITENRAHYQPKNDKEREQLKSIAQLKNIGQSIKSGDQMIELLDEYSAASGATCRKLLIKSSSASAQQQIQLACSQPSSSSKQSDETDAEQEWFFVPPVDGAERADSND